MERYRNVVSDSLGAPLSGVSVTVRIAGTVTAATIYSDDGTTPKANPFTNDSNGSLEFYAANGRYTIVLSKGGVTFDADDPLDLLLYDPIVKRQLTPASTAANTTETDLLSVTLPASTLSYTGQTIRVVCWGTTGATANTKTLRLKFGATTLVTVVIAPGAAEAKEWRLEATITRTGAATQVAIGQGAYDGSNMVIDATAPAETLSGAIVCKLTGQNGTATATDITGTALVVTEP